MVEAEVQFDYIAQEPDELTLHKGDVITEISVQPGGWWEGKLKGKRGMFPDNFVKIVGADDNPSIGNITRRKNGGRRCKVLYSYQPANDDELKLQVNDVIEILDEVEEGWWKGKLRNQTGVFPSNFVSEINDDNYSQEPAQQPTAQKKSPKRNQEESSKMSENSVNHDDAVMFSSMSSISTESDILPILPPKPVKEVCKVLYPYKAVNDDELSLKEGDVITLISRDGQDKGWWKGELHGQIGVFPDNFVQVLPIEEISKPLRPPTKASTITTNRVRDSITKPTLNSSSGSPPTLLNASSSLSQRKVLDTPPKTDEKTSPPGISRKPTLPPPPLKKPQRSPSGSSKQPISSLTVSDLSSLKPENTSTVGSSRSPAVSPAASKPSGKLQETSPQPGKLSPSVKKIESGDGIDGASLSLFSSSSSTFNLNHHNETVMYNSETTRCEIDLDCVGRNAMLTHPTASRVRAPRRRPPSSFSTRDDSSSITNSLGLMNGSVDTHADTKGQGINSAWLEELKMNHARRQFSQGRTKVMIGSGSANNAGGEIPTSPEAPVSPPPTKPSNSGVVFRNNNSPFAPRPQSMFSGEKASPIPRPFSVIGTPSDSITLSVKQWTEINDKVLRLEAAVASQQEVFMEAVKDLTNKINEGTERVLQMQLDIEKLTDLVTQV
ncbi:CIN85 and CD2AP related isoform X2 [Lycorma delicatula]|uniref:CIN85 and CD2AP related isoform X2 n=1 Tax=Lycorma delicatula TaxID=130591 RepID=UPI003F50F38F